MIFSESVIKEKYSIEWAGNVELVDMEQLSCLLEELSLPYIFKDGLVVVLGEQEILELPFKKYRSLH